LDAKVIDITLHVDENTSSTERESLRVDLLNQDGVMSADNHPEVPHLFVVAYDPGKVHAHVLLDIVEKQL